MKVLNSILHWRKRHIGNIVVRRKGRIYVINKKFPKFKARQG